MSASDKRAVPQFGEGFPQLFLRIHDDGAAPGDRLLQRRAGDQQEADTLFSRLYRDLITGVEEDESAVARLF